MRVVVAELLRFKIRIYIYIVDMVLVLFLLQSLSLMAT